MGKNEKMCKKTAHVLVMLGALNLGLVGLGNLLTKDLNVIELILGQWPTLVSVLYLLMGLSALKILYYHSK